MGIKAVADLGGFEGFDITPLFRLIAKVAKHGQRIHTFDLVNLHSTLQSIYTGRNWFCKQR